MRHGFAGGFWVASVVLGSVGVYWQAQSSCVCQVWLNPPQNDGTVERGRIQMTRMTAARVWKSCHLCNDFAEPPPHSFACLHWSGRGENGPSRTCQTLDHLLES